MLQFIAVVVPLIALGALLYVFWPRTSPEKRASGRGRNEAWRQVMLYPKSRWSYVNRYRLDIPYDGTWKAKLNASRGLFQDGLHVSHAPLPAEAGGCVYLAAQALASWGWVSVKLGGGRLKLEWLKPGAYDWLYRIDNEVAEAELDRGQVIATRLAYQLAQLEAGREPAASPTLPVFEKRVTPPMGILKSILLLIGLVAFPLLVLVLMFIWGIKDDVVAMSNKKVASEFAQTTESQLKHADVELRYSFEDGQYPAVLLFPEQSGVPRAAKGMCPKAVCAAVIKAHSGKKVRIGYRYTDSSPAVYALFSIAERGRDGELSVVLSTEEVVRGYERVAAGFAPQ